MSNRTALRCTRVTCSHNPSESVAWRTSLSLWPIHAPIIALAWFLVFPPQAERSGVPLIGPDQTAPISEWQPMRGEQVGESGAFPTKAECEDYRSKTIADARKRLLADAPSGVEKMPSQSSTVQWTFGLAALNSKCISSDDPRLKPK